MIIFKDIITGDELFTDSNKVTLIEDCLYEVLCNHVSRKEGDYQLEGANPSAEGEDGDAGVDETVQSGLDLVLNQRLQETSFDKAAYKQYLKTYTKSLQDKWKEMELSDAQLTEYKEKFTNAVKMVLPKLGDVQYFMGESYNPDGMVPLLEYRDKPDGSGQDAIMMFFKHGLESEKV